MNSKKARKLRRIARERTEGMPQEAYYQTQETTTVPGESVELTPKGVKRKRAFYKCRPQVHGSLDSTKGFYRALKRPLKDKCSG